MPQVALAPVHAPQCVRSVAVFTSQPFAALLSHFAKPAFHVPIAHTPPAPHVAPAFANAQVRPQAPQFVTLLSATSQPLAALPSQSAKPAAQRMPHVPAVQNAVEFEPATQAVPHAPHESGSVCVLRQVPEQLFRPVPHEVAQAEFEHTWPPPHAFAHVPQ